MDLLGPTSQSFISQRLRLHYVDWGNTEKPPLLLIHGGRDHCRVLWLWNFIVSIDLSGAGPRNHDG